MYYQILVTKFEDNPEYDPAKAAAARANQERGIIPNWDAYHVQPVIETDQLKVNLSETEYAAIKHAVMETWK